MADIIQFPLRMNDSREKKKSKWRKAGYAVGITLAVIFLPLVWAGILASLLFGKRSKEEDSSQVRIKGE